MSKRIENTEKSHTFQGHLSKLQEHLFLAKRTMVCATKSKFERLGVELYAKELFYEKWRTQVFFVGPLIPFFWTYDGYSGFKSQRASLACFLAKALSYFLRGSKTYVP